MTKIIKIIKKKIKKMLKANKLEEKKEFCCK